MTNNLSRLEFLPNEIFIELFQYYDAYELFCAFYNLNTRFNRLLQSLQNLSITFTTFSAYDIIYSFIQPDCIRSLTLGCDAEVNLNVFTNLRRLKFLHPTCAQFDELNSTDLPYLEHLHIYSEPDFSFDPAVTENFLRCNKVFPNTFPSLITCHLLHVDGIYNVPRAIHSLRLRALVVRSISLTAYAAILSACPNLDFFRYRLPLVHENSVLIKSHLNLRRMIIDSQDYFSSLDDYDIGDYLSCVPNLEQLSVYQENDNPSISSYLKYNWLASSIEQYLSSLRRFQYHLSIYSAEELMTNHRTNVLNRLEESFRCAHHTRYRSKLVVRLYPYSIIDLC